MEIKCQNCGANVPEESAFCPNCGNSMPKPAPTQPDAQTYTAPGQQPPYTAQQPYGQQPPYTSPAQPPYGQQGVPTPPYYDQKSRIAAGLLGIFLGELGIHNFYLGNTQRALIQLLVGLIGGVITCGVAAFAMWVWGLVEGIQILTGTINVDARGVPLKD